MQQYGATFTSLPEKHRVLVVDDDEGVREVFALLLRKEGYEVAAAENGFDGLPLRNRLSPHARWQPKMGGGAVFPVATSYPSTSAGGGI